MIFNILTVQERVTVEQEAINVSFRNVQQRFFQEHIKQRSLCQLILPSNRYGLELTAITCQTVSFADTDECRAGLRRSVCRIAFQPTVRPDSPDGMCIVLKQLDFRHFNCK